MARTSIIDPIFIEMAREAGKDGVTLTEVALEVDSRTEGARGLRGVESRAKALLASGKLVRKFQYYYPVLESGEQMKSPVRRYVYLAPEYGVFEKGIETR